MQLSDVLDKAKSSSVVHRTPEQVAGHIPVPRTMSNSFWIHSHVCIYRCIYSLFMYVYLSIELVYL